VKLEETRPGIFTVTMTAHELSVLVAGARMSLDLMESTPGIATGEARNARLLGL
jgi:hypothetical protein